MSIKYDEALFRQLLSNRKDKNGEISTNDIFLTFCSVAPEVNDLAFEDQDEILFAQSDSIIPQLIERILQQEGWIISDWPRS